MLNRCCIFFFFFCRFAIKGRLQKSVTQDEMNLTRQELMIMALSMALLTVCAFPSRISQKRALDSEVVRRQCCLACTVVFYAISYLC